MALTNLQQSLDRSNSAFAQRLQQVSGYADSILQAEARKQQLAQQAQSQKDLIDYRYDRKQKYYDDVTQPQQQAASQSEMLQGMSDDADSKIDEWEGWLVREGSADMTRFGLDNIRFRKDMVQQDGEFAGIEANAYLKTENGYSKLGSDFRNEFTDRRGFANELASVYDSSEEIKSSDNLNGFDPTQPQAIIIGNDKQGQEFKNKLRSDPKFRREMLAAYQSTNKISFGRSSDEGQLGSGGSGSSMKGEDLGSKTRQNNVVSHLNKIDEFFGGEDSLKMGFIDNIEGGSLSPFNDKAFFTDEHATGGIVDKNTSVGEIYQQIDRTMQMVLPEKLSKKFEGVGSLSDGEIEIIMSGDTGVDGFDKLPESRQEIVSTLANYKDDTRGKISKLLRLRKTYQDLIGEYKNETGYTFDEDNLMLNPNMPDQINREKPFEQVFVKVPNQRAKWGQWGKYYNRDSDVQSTYEFTQK